MAAFPFQQPALLPDYAFLPEEFVPNFNQFYSSFENVHEGRLLDASARESSCVEQKSVYNKTSVLETQKNCNLVDKAVNSEQLTQNCVLVDKKRKSSNVSSLNSANSKDVKVQVKSKKQKGDKETMNDKKNDNKGQSKSTDEPPKGYIHVRARRGQATDSHSLAERVRREKISKKMGTLQGLVPGCDKVTGKALMLDEIINYVQSLQNQVEFLSMKLASLDPMVYQFGLMDLDPMVYGANVQGMINNMAMQNPLVMQSASSNASRSNSPAQSSFPTANNSCLTSPASSSAPSPIFLNPQADDSTNFLQHDLKPNFLHFQDVGSSYWGVNEQERQSIINQFGLSGNNLYSLQ